MIKEPKLPGQVAPDDFASICEACNDASLPRNWSFRARDRWRAVLTFAYMTGGRIRELVLLRREDLDREDATAITRAADNKGKRDNLVPLHPVVIDSVRRIASFEPSVFPWYHDERTL